MHCTKVDKEIEMKKIVTILVGMMFMLSMVTGCGRKDTGSDAAIQNVQSEVDYDLTTMSPTMVYGTVYQMMVYPEKYIGKTVKMRGTYTYEFYDKTNQYYHYVQIADAAACCAQGIEFVWQDGSHAFPESYPDEAAEIEVIGTFETYEESGDSNLYCRLANSEMRVLGMDVQ